MPISMRRLKGSQSHAELRPTNARKEISLPVQLISTTNMLSYEAPDLPIARQMMAARQSDESSNPPTDVPGLSPDGSSVSSSPAVEYNHLSAYFPGPTVKRSASARQNQAADADAPAVPKRVPSHSKREHERLARKRSIRSGRSSPTTSAPSSPTIGSSDSNAPQRTSFEMMGVTGSEPLPKMTAPSPATRHRSPTTGSNHPFSPELEKLNEVVEDYKGMSGETSEPEDEDAQHMRKLGLVKIAAADYRNDVGVCYPRGVFDIGLPYENTGGWI